ncbi:MAG: glycosyltransferase family 2 protein [Candidatus Aenigmarchaeota archaeon]|nr:glycosyltransferase family 2 protein [Candidatus Aenigmarchaeota archaeon]
MIQYVLWAISFVFLWLSLVWLNYLYVSTKSSTVGVVKKGVTIAVPAFNEERSLYMTLDSIRRFDYPHHLLSVVVVDDGSKDSTTKKCREFMAAHNEMSIRLIRQKNQGKAGAINTALGVCGTDYFAVLDADTFAKPDALNALLGALQQSGAAAAISVVKVFRVDSLLERVQNVEYIMSNLFRRLMAVVDTLFLTHGCLCVFKTEVLKSIGGFSVESGHTEDLEVALRLRSNKHKVVMAQDAITYTAVPASFWGLWRQRVRWYRGFMFNHLKFRSLFFNKKYGRLGFFQLPVNVLSVGLLLATIGMVAYGSSSDFFEFVYRSFTIQGYFINHVIDFPTLKELILGQNVQIIFPVFMSMVLGLYVIVAAFHQLDERVRPALLYIWIYFAVSPYITSTHWLCAIFQETFAMKRKWR